MHDRASICAAVLTFPSENLYFGTGIFDSTTESIVYSHVYKFFLSDELLFYNANELLFKSERLTKKDHDDFIERAKVYLDKLFIIDKIYFGDYFKTNNYEPPSRYSS